MRRISAIFIAVCMVLIAGSIGAVLYLGFKVDELTSVIVALAALTAMALYNAVSGRLRDRGEVGDQIADLSRGTGDLARRKLLPALYHRELDRQLPERARIIGISRRAGTSDAYRNADQPPNWFPPRSLKFEAQVPIPTKTPPARTEVLH